FTPQTLQSPFHKPAKECEEATIYLIKIILQSLSASALLYFMDRIKDEKLRKAYRSHSCEVCSSWKKVSGHHIKSRGAFGADLEMNLVALCLVCHTGIHKMGTEKFINKHSIYAV